MRRSRGSARRARSRAGRCRSSPRPLLPRSPLDRGGQNERAMSILHSYRWRRRIAFSAIALGVAVPLIWLGVRYSNPGNPQNANGPTVADLPVTKDVPFTAAERKRVHKVLKEFIGTAVVRRNVAKSWNIAGPT